MGMNLRGMARIGVACLIGTAATAVVATPTSAETEAHYIVVLETAAGVDARAASVAARFDSTVEHTYRHVLPGFSLRLSQDEARKLAGAAGVASVLPDSEVHALGEQVNPPSWGLDRIDQRDRPLDLRYRYPNEAEGSTAYVLDTGVRHTHQDLAGRVLPGYDFTDDDTDASDENGHGTFVAGIIGGTAYGVAKKIDIVPVKVLGSSGSGTVADVIAGIDWVVQHATGPAVANMSIGGSPNQALDDAVRAAIASGVSVTVAAGGSASDAGNFSPARVVEALTIGASDIRDCLSSSTNRGPAVDMFAPGVNITGPWIGSDTSSNTMSGSSLSAPHVAGAVGIYLHDHPTATATEVSAALVAASTQDRLCNVPANTANRLLYVG